MRRNFRKEVSRRKIDKASKDYRTLLGGVQDVQRRFKVGYVAAREAVDAATQAAEIRGASVRLRRERRIDRLIKSVRKAERRYPGILGRIMRSKDFSAIAKKYASKARKGRPLTRPRVYQINTALRSLSKMADRSVASIVRDAEAGTLRTRLETELVANRL